MCCVIHSECALGEHSLQRAHTHAHSHTHAQSIDCCIMKSLIWFVKPAGFFFVPPLKLLHQGGHGMDDYEITGNLLTRRD